MKYLIDAVVIILCVVVFSSLVVPTYRTEPFFLAMPRTLWTGILVSVSITLLTIVRALLKE